MRLESVGSGLRNYVLGGRDVASITFYGNGQVYARVGRGWLENQTFQDDGKPHGFTNDLAYVEIDEPVRATKEKLTRTDNYFIPTNRKRVLSSDPSQYDVYIYLASPPEDMGERLSMDGTQEKRYTTYARIAVPCGHRVLKSHDDLMNRTTYETVPADGFVIPVASRTVKTDFGGEVERLDAEFKAKGIPINGYAVGELLKHYNVVPK